MKKILCFFAIALSLAVYPFTLLINSELVPIFHYIEVDFFNWARMLLVSAVGIFSLTFFRRTGMLLGIYTAILLLSCVASRYPETCLFGTPMHHEGLFAILGYIGLFQAVKEYGLFKELEKSLSVVVYATALFALLQIVYGNFLNFPLFKLLIPKLEITAETWPIYGNMAGPNHLGLFCALFLPYAIIRKKHVESILLMLLLIGSQSRGAWLSALITTAAISRRYLIYLAVTALLLSIPMHSIVTWAGRRTLKDIHYPIRDSDLSGRAYMWKRSIPMLKDTIALGKGPSTFSLYFPQFTERGDRMGFFLLAVDRPHNMFINIWQNTGLLSLMAIGALVSRLVYLGRDASLRMGAIGFLIAGLFTDSMLCVTPYFFIFLGGLAYEHNEARRHD